MPDAEKGADAMTLAEVDAMTGDDILFWLQNPFMSPEMLAEKVCWWVTQAVQAGASQLIRCPCGCSTRHNADGSCTNCGRVLPPVETDGGGA